jgi:hypothetical protein
VDGEASIGRAVAFMEDKDYDEVMKKAESMPKTKFGDVYDIKHVESLNKLTNANMA